MVGSHPAGLAFDSSGNLYVAYTEGFEIVKFDSGGNETLFARTGGAYGLAFSTEGTLYGVNATNNVIEAFDSSGNPSFFANSDVHSPSFIAVTLVPELGTWKMVALGVGVLVGSRRLRRRLS
jgi:DNA-binding beta-propeller fold protein YncE